MKKIYVIVLLFAQSFFFSSEVNAQNLTFQSTLDVTNITGAAGHAGIVFTGTEFWVSRWASDSLFRISPTGTLLERFTIAGVTGVRALTWDGTSIYAGLNTATISRINPTTKTVTGTITAPLNVRHISYVPTANSGAGGFWVGNFGTDLILISMTGSTLQTIPASTHGLTGMYGSGYDTTTAGGGPWLWIYNQGTPNNSTLVRIPVSSGVPNFTYDTFPDGSTGLTSSLAGGAFLSTTINPGSRTLLALAQGTPNNFIYRYTVNSTLPIEYSHLSADKIGELNTVKWTTSSEQNNKGFEIQRSYNGKDFTTIDFVSSKAINGNSSTTLSYNYSYKSASKLTSYYRLKQIDKDGKSSISKIVVIKSFSGKKIDISSIYPNPAKSHTNITIEADEDCKVVVAITDITGKRLMVQNKTATKGSNFFTVDLQSIENGNYLLQVYVDGALVISSKLVKH